MRKVFGNVRHDIRIPADCIVMKNAAGRWMTWRLTPETESAVLVGEFKVDPEDDTESMVEKIKGHIFMDRAFSYWEELDRIVQRENLQDVVVELDRLKTLLLASRSADIKEAVAIAKNPTSASPKELIRSTLLLAAYVESLDSIVGG